MDDHWLFLENSNQRLFLSVDAAVSVTDMEVLPVKYAGVKNSLETLESAGMEPRVASTDSMGSDSPV